MFHFCPLVTFQSEVREGKTELETLLQRQHWLDELRKVNSKLKFVEKLCHIFYFQELWSNEVKGDDDDVATTDFKTVCHGEPWVCASFDEKYMVSHLVEQMGHHVHYVLILIFTK